MRKISFLALVLLLTAVAAHAADFGAHVGYFDNDVKKAYVGADLSLPFGPVALMPNADYTRSNGISLWFASVDLDLMYSAGPNNPKFWFGAGPTFADISSGGGFFDNGKSNAWGWDVNGGVGFGMGALRPYVTGRYNKVSGLKAGGIAVGLRFGGQ